MWWLAVPLAIAGAAAFAGAAYLQHLGARRAPDHGPMRPRLLWDLLQQRTFRWSILLSVSGFVLQVAALRLAALAVVQPLLVTQLLFYLAIAALRERRRPDTRLLLAALMAMAGLAGFQLVAHPAQPAAPASFSGVATIPLGIALGALVLCALASTRVLHAEWKALPFAAATAVFYGVTAGLVRSLVTSVEHESWYAQWELYAIIVIAPIGFLLNQNAFQEGRIGSVAVATITVGDPAVSIGVGAAWLGESLQSGLWWTVAQILTLVLMTSGIVLLADRAHQVSGRVGRPDGRRQPDDLMKTT